MKSFLLLAMVAPGLLATGCNGSDATCEDVDCDDGNPCTEDSCNASNGACENARKPDWAACDSGGRRGACHDGACAELEWPTDFEEREQIKAWCENRSIESCAEDARCANLTASRFDPSLVCLEASTAVGCTIGFLVCGLSITTGMSPSGELYRFASTCLPKDWTFASNELRAVPVTDAGSCEWLLDQWPTDEVAQTIREECEALSGRQCGGRDDCRTIFPYRVDDERVCLEISGSHEVCTSRFRACDPTPTVARTPAGDSFVIGNGCVLGFWEITGNIDGEQSHIFSWPTCAVR